MTCEGSGAVPALHHWFDREPVVLADRDDPAGVDERVDFGLVELPGVWVEAHGVDRQELVRVVVVELGALMRAERVLDSEFVQ